MSRECVSKVAESSTEPAETGGGQGTCPQVGESQAAPQQPREQAERLGRRSVCVLWTCAGRENTEGQNKGAARDHGHSLICSHSQIFLEHLLHTGPSFKYRGYHRGQNESVCPHGTSLGPGLWGNNRENKHKEVKHFKY